MKRFMLMLPILLTACSDSGSSPASARAATPIWPPANAIQTSSFGSYSCSVITGLGVGCYDGTNAPSYQATPYDTSSAAVVVGNGIACIMVDSGGSPFACITNLADPACANAPTNASIACWTPSAPTPVVMDIPDQVGFGSNPAFFVGPSELTVDVNGTVCVTDSIYDSGTGAFVTTRSACGDTISVLNYLQ